MFYTSPYTQTEPLIWSSMAPDDLSIKHSESDVFAKKKTE